MDEKRWIFVSFLSLRSWVCTLFSPQMWLHCFHITLLCIWSNAVHNWLFELGLLFGSSHLQRHVRQIVQLTDFKREKDDNFLSICILLRQYYFLFFELISWERAVLVNFTINFAFFSIYNISHYHFEEFYLNTFDTKAVDQESHFLISSRLILCFPWYSAEKEQIVSTTVHSRPSPQ